MRLLLLALGFFSSFSLFADQAVPTKSERTSFQPFTGKILKSRVRFRLQPSLDAYVFSELNKNDYVLVLDQVDDFYACEPPRGLKGYIFRTYILDGCVEGNNVNVRLEPDITSPVITQLNSGDSVKGEIAPQNNKWLQIDLPESVRFYVAKEYVTKAGEKELFGERIARLKQAEEALARLEVQLEQELQKPFPQITLAPIVLELNKLVAANQDLPEQIERADKLLAKAQESYLAKSLAYKGTGQPAPVPVPEPEKTPEIENRSKTAAETEATLLTGIVKPYNSFAKNRPGDYMLVDAKSQLPVAFLSSTHVDLKNCVNKNVTIEVEAKANNAYALPAFVVVKVK